jgi:ACS family tartrate transporter-like MFS transporter
LPGQRCDVAGGGDEAGGGAEVAAADDAGGGGNEARGGAEVAAAVFAGFAFVRAAGGFMAAGANGSSSVALLCFAQIGVSSVPPMFWPLPASFLTGASAAAGIAAINSLGNLSGFAGPFAMGYLKDLTGNFTVGLLLLAGCAVLGAAVVVTLRIDAKREQSSGAVALAH